MKLATKNGKTYLDGFTPEEQSLGGLETFKRAYVLGLLPEGRKVFAWGSSRMFCIIKGGIMRTYCMRENWNGWNDLAAYALPDFEEIGTTVPADPAAGRHRNVVVIE